MAQKIRVMVVDDSMLFRTWLIKSLQEDPRFEVVGFAINALDAKSKLPVLKPDIMTMDIEMPGMTGLQFLKEVLPVHPVPIILVSSLNVQVFDALAAGAVDFVRKPESEPGARDRFILTLRSKPAIGKNAHPRLPSHDPAAMYNKAKTASIGSTISSNGGIGLQHTASAAPAGIRKPVLAAPVNSNIDVIAIGASTGGTEAILEVVRHFPAKMPGIVITQHMPAGFTSMYAERLNRICNLEVKEAKHGDKIRPGLVLLAPGGLQMRVVRMGSGYAVSCSDGEKVSGHKPSVDVLFDSVASTVRNRAIGVILTGMGADGAAGMLRMRKAGAYTIGQDRDSCVVYGMPMEAFKIGAVCMQSPLSSIHHAVMGRLSKG